MRILFFDRRYFTVLVFMLMCASALAVTKTVTYTIESTSSVSVSGDAPLGSSAAFETTSSNRFNLTSGKSMTLTLHGYEGVKITQISMQMCSNAKAGSGYLSVKAGSTSLLSIGTNTKGIAFNDRNWNGSYTSDYTNVSKAVSEYEIQDDENVVIVIGATANSLYCKSFTLSYEEVNVFVPESITLSGNYKTSFNQYEEFSHDGMIVTAKNANDENLDVTDYCDFAGYSMNNIGLQTVTVNCRGVTKMYDINVSQSHASKDVLKYTTLGLLSTNDRKIDNVVVDNGLGNAYVGNAAKNENTIQLGTRTNLVFRYVANSQACGYVKNVKIRWSSSLNTPSTNHILSVYGQNTQYSGEMNAVSGTHIGILSFNSETLETSLNVGCEYKYIMIVSQEGTCYMDAIEIEWLLNPYTRFVSSDNLGTICLPYNVGNVTGATVYEIVGKETESEGLPTKVYFEEVSSLTAGHPYIFRATADKQVFDMTGTNVSNITSNRNGLYGTFSDYPFSSDVNFSETNYYIINSDNEIQRASSASGVYANRAFIKMDEVPLYEPSSSRERVLVLDENGYSFEEATDISEIISSQIENDVEIYTLGGVKINDLQRGVNIVRMSDGSVKKVLKR